jgi:hypothetical protein
MTYAGFKSMFHAGLSPDDLRVRAAFDWIRHHWTFDENPGLGQQGLYYYYHTMARALRAAQQDVITDIDGNSHNWREELIDALVARQRDDGSWVNSADRWLEGRPVMATVFAVLALEEALKPVVPRPVAALRFAVTYDGSITESYSGRVYVMLSTTASPEPRHGPAWRNTAPFFGLDVEDWKPDTPLVFDEGALGFPGPPDTIEQQDYWIQAVMRRNLDSPSIGDGQGTAVSAVVTRELEGPTGGEVVLRIDRLVGGQPFAAANDIRLIETRSDLLSDFYGRDVMLRAAVILPPGYDETDRRYPALYFIGGFGSDHRLAPIVKRWFSALAGAERVCFVVPDPLCRTGHHAFADSDNNGPRGRALVEELIPAIERQLRLVAAPTARFLTGVSSGGWSSLWLQVAHPDFFGGVWSVAPDPVDFRAFQRIDVYAPGANVYLDEHGKPRPIMRMRDRVMMWYEPFAKMEWVQGEGGQVGSFEAVFSPRGPDGRPALLFDRETGDVDPVVARGRNVEAVRHPADPPGELGAARAEARRQGERLRRGQRQLLPRGRGRAAEGLAGVVGRRSRRGDRSRPQPHEPARPRPAAADRSRAAGHVRPPSRKRAVIPRRRYLVSSTTGATPDQSRRLPAESLPWRMRADDRGHTMSM